MATMKQNKNFIYLVSQPNEIFHEALHLKQDQIVNLGAFIVAAVISKARRAGLSVKNEKECMLVFSNGKFIVGVPKTISPDPVIFFNDIAMLEKL